MSDRDDVTFEVVVRVPPSAASAFALAMTGNDDDVILAAEHAINDRLGLPHAGAVELEAPHRAGILRDALADAAAAHVRGAG